MKNKTEIVNRTSKIKVEETVQIYVLKNLPKVVFDYIKQSEAESAQVWNYCKNFHQQARLTRTVWPDRKILQLSTKDINAKLNSQSIQMVCHAFLGNIKTTKELRRQGTFFNYPHKNKKFYSLLWPEQAIHWEENRIVLPMGRNNPSLVLKVKVPKEHGACKIVWKNGYELHISIHREQKENPNGVGNATVDLGEIHLAAVVCDNGNAALISGRGIRSIKRQSQKVIKETDGLARRCKNGSRRHKKIMRAKRKQLSRNKRRVRDLRHKATRQVVQFLQDNNIKQVFIGNPHGIPKSGKGKKQNSRMSLWEYGKDTEYIMYKSKLVSIDGFTGKEWGTSSTCPVCNRRQKVKGRNWNCKGKECLFKGHRDFVGGTNMHPLAFGKKIAFPTKFTYLRPGFLRRTGSSSSLVTGQSSLKEKELSVNTIAFMEKQRVSSLKTDHNSIVL